MINLPAIFIANGIGIMLMVIILLSSNHSVRYGLLDDKLFYSMIILTLLQCFVESICFYIDGQVLIGYRTLSILLNCMLFINNIVFAFIWTIYADFKLFEDINRIRKYYVWIGIPAFLIIITSLMNLVTPIFYMVSADNIYHRTSLYLIPYIMTYLYLAYGVILIYSNREKVEKYLFLPAIVFMIPIGIGSLLQFFYYGLSLVWVGVAIALVALYINVQNETSYIDGLSGLLNRQYLNHYLYSESKKVTTRKIMAGIMLDIDHFKGINDRFGHLVGDEAIVCAGEILRKSTTGKGIAMRYAGDEFVVMVLVKEEKEIHDLMNRIKKEIEDFNAKKEKVFQLHFSMGFSVFERNKDTIDNFFGRMDQAMYVEKRNKINKHEFPDRRSQI